MLVIRERYSSVWNSCDSKEERFAIVQFQFSLYFDFKLWTDFTCFRFWHSFRFMNNILCSTFWGVVAKKVLHFFLSFFRSLSIDFCHFFVSILKPVLDYLIASADGQIFLSRSENIIFLNFVSKIVFIYFWQFFIENVRIWSTKYFSQFTSLLIWMFKTSDCFIWFFLATADFSLFFLSNKKNNLVKLAFYFKIQVLNIATFKVSRRLIKILSKYFNF